MAGSPCPECKDSGYFGDQGPGSLYFRGRATGNSEYVPCQCDPQARAARNLARRPGNDEMTSPRPTPKDD